jgi:hypothetical protein
MELVGEPLEICSAIKADREPELDALADAIYASLMI